VEPVTRNLDVRNGQILRGGQRDLRPQRVTVDWGRIDGIPDSTPQERAVNAEPPAE